MPGRNRYPRSKTALCGAILFVECCLYYYVVDGMGGDCDKPSHNLKYEHGLVASWQSII